MALKLSSKWGNSHDLLSFGQIDTKCFYLSPIDTNCFYLMIECNSSTLTDPMLMYKK